MGLPNVTITFQQLATAVAQAANGILALVIKDNSVASGVTLHTVLTEDDIPDGLDDTNEAYIEQALLGADDNAAPSKILVVTIQDDAADYTDALSYLETLQFDVVTIPAIADEDVAAISTWAEGCRDSKDLPFLCVLPGSVSDHESIVNFDTDDIDVGENTYTANQYLARIAGILAGLPYTISPTFHVLSEVDDVPHLTKTEANAAINAGKLILYHDGAKVKIARGVTSLTTTTTKGTEWTKIKIVRILDKIYKDLKALIEDTYVGKVGNSYQNKLLLIAAINGYFETLERLGLLDENADNVCAIDVDAQKTYLLSQGVDATAMTEQEIKEYNTDDKVYLTSTVRPLDAIEDVQLTINI